MIDGTPRRMLPTGPSTQYRRGVRFGYSAKLPAGRHRIGFEARSVDGGTAAAPGGWIRIVARRAPSGTTTASGGSGGWPVGR